MIERLNNHRNYYLATGIVAISSTLAIIILLLSISFSSPGSLNHSISIKPGYESWVWGIYTLSIIITNFLLSKTSQQSKTYTHPIFKLAIKVAQIFAALGLILSLIVKDNDVLYTNPFMQIANASTQFLNSIFILFIFVQLGAGVNSIKSYMRST
jgi:uncharacterized protein YacL